MTTEEYSASNEGKLSAASAVGGSTSSMLQESPTSPNTPSVTDTLGSSSEGSRDVSNSGIGSMNTGEKGAVEVPKSFVSQPFRQTIVEVQPESVATNEKEDVSKLSSKEVSALSSYSGVDIKTDADLNKALGVTSQRLSEQANLASTDLLDVTTPEVGLATDSSLDQLKLDALKTLPDVDGIDVELDSTFLSVPNVTDIAGNSIDGIPEDADFEQTSAINQAISMFCSDHDLSLRNFGLDLNLYLALLSLCGKLGLSGLLAQLAACDKALFDGGGMKILQDTIPTSASTGDIKTVATISEILGPGHVNNPENQMDVVLKSMSSEKNNDLSDVQKAFTSFGISKDSTVKKTVPDTDIQVLSMDTLRSYDHNPDVVNDIIGESDADLMRSIKFA